MPSFAEQHPGAIVNVYHRCKVVSIQETIMPVDKQGKQISDGWAHTIFPPTRHELAADGETWQAIGWSDEQLGDTITLAAAIRLAKEWSKAHPVQETSDV